MTFDRKLEWIMADNVDPGQPQDPAPVAPPRGRVLLPLVENAHAAEPGDEMTPERVAAVLQQDDATNLHSV